MKRFFNVLAITLACVFAVGMTACEGTNPGGNNITVNPATVNFDGTGGTEYVTVGGSDWSISNSSGWVTAVKEGNAVKVTVGAATATRTGSFTVSNSTDSKVVTVVQTVTAASSLIDDLVGTYSVTGFFINSNGAYDAAHTSIITKVDANTVKIKYFLGTDTLFDDPTDTNLDEITATLSGTTLTLASKQEVSWNDDYKNMIIPARENTYCDNLALALPTYEVVGSGMSITISFDDPNGYAQSVDGVNVKGSYIIVATDKSTGDCLGGFGNFANTKFAKVSNSTTLAPNMNAAGTNNYLKYTMPTFVK